MKILPNGTFGEIIHNRSHSRICYADPKIEAKAKFLNDIKDLLNRQFWNLRKAYDTIAAV